MSKNLCRSNKGMTLIEVMIVAGILGVLALVVMNLTQQTSKTTVKAQYDTDIIQATNEMNAILSNQDNCTDTFNPSSSATVTSPQFIKKKNPAIQKYYISTHASAPAEGYGSSHFKIISYSLTDLAPTLPNEARLTIVFEKKEMLKTTGSTTMAKTFNIYWEGTFADFTLCRSLSNAVEDIWTRGSGANIYYPVGNVGINTGATPATKLEIRSAVAGPITNFTQAVGSAGILIDTDIVNATHNSGLFWRSSNNVPDKPKAGIWMYQENGPGSWLMFGTSNTYATGITNTAMAINPTGYVGIGITTPLYHLDLYNGNARAGAFIVNSDIRLKEQILPIESALEKIDALRGVTYKWNELAKDKGMLDEGRQLGVIAQEVEKVFPEAVKKGADGIKTVNYQILVAPLIESVKELNKQNKQQQKEINQLKKENSTLRDWICSQKKKPASCN